MNSRYLTLLLSPRISNSEREYLTIPQGNDTNDNLQSNRRNRRANKKVFRKLIYNIVGFFILLILMVNEIIHDDYIRLNNIPDMVKITSYTLNFISVVFFIYLFISISKINMIWGIIYVALFGTLNFYKIHVGYFIIPLTKTVYEIHRNHFNDL